MSQLHAADHVEDEKITVEHLDGSGAPMSQVQAGGHTVTRNVSPLQELGVWQSIKTFHVAVFYCMLVGWNALNDGYQLSLPGNVIAMEGFIDQFGIMFEGTLQLDANTVSAWGGAYTAGYIVILLCGSYPVDLFGRKYCLLAVQLFLIIACLLEMFAKTWQVWLAAKIFDGLSVGLNQAVASTLVSELAPTNARGAVLALYQFWFAFGQFGAAIATKVVADMPANKWRHAIYSEWVFAGIALIIWPFLPESPRWLAVKGKHDKAKAVLNRLNGKVDGYDVDSEFEILIEEIEDGKRLTREANALSFWAIFRGTNLRRTLISWGPFSWQQWIGVPVIFGYTSYFFQLAKLKDPFMGTVAVYLVLIVFVAISFFAVEKMGRRRLLLIGGSTMLVCLLIVGGMGTIPDPTPASGGVLVAFSCVWVAAYALTAGPVGYVYLAETSTPILRARTVSVAAAMSGMLNLIVNYCTPLMLAATGANWGVKGVSFFYAGTGFIGLVLVYFFIPETKGRSFLELDELFERKIPARKFASTRTLAEENVIGQLDANKV